MNLSCKFCKRTVVVPDLQPDTREHDIFNSMLRVLLSLACCNRCADLRIRKRRVTGWLDHLIFLGTVDPKDKEVRETVLKGMAKAIQEYIEVVAGIVNRDPVQFEEAMPEGLLRAAIKKKETEGRVDRIQAVMGTFWPQARQEVLI